MSEDFGREGVFATSVDRVAESVGEGVCVHITGPRGSGRSVLLGLVARRLENAGRSVLRVYGNPAWRHEPYAALASSLSASGIGATAPGRRRAAGERTTGERTAGERTAGGRATGGRATVERGIRERGMGERAVGDIGAALAQRLGRVRTIITVDDADELDGPSTGALLAAYRRHDVVAVTTSRPRRPARPDSLMLGLSPAVRLLVPVLNADQVHAVSRQILGGPVDAPSLARIATQSGGLFGLVRAIVSAGQRTGVLREANGIWTMPRGIWSDELGAAAEPFLADAGPRAWADATALAVAGPLPLDEAESLLGRDALDCLFAAGLAHDAEDAAGVMAGIYPPLLAEYLRREGPPLARARASGLASRTGTGLSQITRAHGGPGAAAVLSQRAVREAAGDVSRLTEIWQADPTPSTAMPLLVAMRAAGIPPGRIVRVMAATADGDSFDTARLHSWYATWKATDQGELEAALAALDDISGRLPRYRDFFEVTRAHVIFLRDRVPDLGPLAELPPSPDTELLLVLRAELLLAQGRVEQARHLLTDFRPRGRVASGQSSLLNALGAVLGGDLEIGATLAHRGLPGMLGPVARVPATRGPTTAKGSTAPAADTPGTGTRGLGDPGLVQAHAYTAGLALTVAGRLTEGADVLFGALSSATVASYRDPYHAGVLVLAGIIALAQGRAGYARALAAQAEAADIGHGPYPAMDHRCLTAMLDASGPPAPAQDPEPGDLWQLVEERISRGYLTSAVFLAADAVERSARAGHTVTGLAATVRDLGRGMEGRLLPALARYVAAAAEKDEAALVPAARELDAAGATLYAVRAEVTRCLLLRRAGRGEEAAAAAQQAWHHSGVAALDRAGLFARLRRDVGLSEREQEILAMAADLRTTAEIADTLTMSTRTAETHLHNISRKAGLRGRDMLAHAGTTWLRPAQQLPGVPADRKPAKNFH